MEEKSNAVTMNASVKKELADITYHLENDKKLRGEILAYTVPAKPTATQEEQSIWQLDICN